MFKSNRKHYILLAAMCLIIFSSVLCSFAIKSNDKSAQAETSTIDLSSNDIGVGFIPLNISDQFDFTDSKLSVQFDGKEKNQLFFYDRIAGSTINVSEHVYITTSINAPLNNIVDSIKYQGTYYFWYDVIDGKIFKENENELYNETNGILSKVQTIDNYQVIEFVIQNSDYYEVEFDFSNADSKSSEKYQYNFNGQLHSPVIKFIDSTNKYASIPQDSYEVTYRNANTMSGGVQVTPLYSIDDIYCFVSNATDKKYLVDTFISKNAFTIVSNNEESENSYGVEFNCKDIVSGINNTSGSLGNITAQFYYTGKNIDYNISFKTAKNTIALETPNYKVIKFFEIKDISDYLYNRQVVDIGSEAPINVGYYYAQVEYISNGVTVLRDSLPFEIIQKDGENSNLIYFTYNNDIKFKRDFNLDLKFWKNDGSAIVGFERVQSSITANNQYLITFYNSANDNNSITQPSEKGEYFFTITISNSSPYSFFDKFDGNNITNAKTSNRFKLTISPTKVSVNISNTTDKIYNGDVDAKDNIKFDMENGKISLKNVVEGEDVFIDMEKTTIKFNNANVNQPDNKVTIKFVLAGDHKDLYTIDEISLNLSIIPKKLYVKGENKKVFFHETEGLVYQYELYDSDRFTNLITANQLTDAKVLGSPRSEYCFDVGEYSITYEDLVLDGSGKDNYELIIPAVGEYKLTIQRTVVEITPTNLPYVYGTSDPIITVDNNNYLNIAYTYDSGLFTRGYTLNNVYFTRLAGVNVGSYPISIDKIVLSRENEVIGSTESALHYLNYEFVIKADSNYEIIQKPITITALEKTVYYGEEYIIEYNSSVASSLIQGDQMLLTLKSPSVNAGTYNIQISKLSFLNEAAEDITNNYNVTFETAPITINKRNVSVELDEDNNVIHSEDIIGSYISKIYGEQDPEFVTKIIEHQAVGYGMLDGHTYEFTVLRQAGNNAGFYSLPNGTNNSAVFKYKVYDASGREVTNNYAITFNNNNNIRFRILKREIKVSILPLKITLSSNDKDRALADFLQLKSNVVYNFVGEMAGSEKTDMFVDYIDVEWDSAFFDSFYGKDTGIVSVRVLTTDTTNYSLTVNYGISRNNKLTVDYKNNYVRVLEIASGENVSTNKMILMNNKIWKTLAITQVSSQDGAAPSEGVMLPVTITIPEGFSDQEFSLYFVNSEGKFEKFESFTIENGEVVFETNIFGDYYLVYDSGLIIYVILAVIALVLIIAVVVVIIVIKKKKNKDKPKEEKKKKEPKVKPEKKSKKKEVLSANKVVIYDDDPSYQDTDAVDPVDPTLEDTNDEEPAIETENALDIENNVSPIDVAPLGDFSFDNLDSLDNLVDTSIANGISGVSEIEGSSAENEGFLDLSSIELGSFDNHDGKDEGNK